jgi:competence protein ComEA
MKLKTLSVFILSLNVAGVALASHDSLPTKDLVVTQSVVKTTKNNILNINFADAKSFATLKGVSKKKAAAIISYRHANGNFKSVDELSKVKGMNQKVIDKNRARLTV